MPRGIAVIRRLATVLQENELPPYLMRLLARLNQHCGYLCEQIEEIKKELRNHMADDETVQRLLSIPGIWTITASLLAIRRGDGKITPAAVILLRQQGRCLTSRVPEGKTLLWGSVSRVIKI